MVEIDGEEGAVDINFAKVLVIIMTYVKMFVLVKLMSMTLKEKKNVDHGKSELRGNSNGD